MKFLSLMWGFTIGLLFDFTIGGGLIDYYRVNDLNKYEVADIFIIYCLHLLDITFLLYDAIKIRKESFIVYVLIWAFIGVIALWILTLLIL